MMPLRRAVPGGPLPGVRRTVALVAVSVVSVLAAATAQARLLVTDDSGHRVSRYNARTGAFVDTLVPMGGGGLQSPDGLAVGPDDKLYVSDPTGILRYDQQTGAFIDTFVPAGLGGLENPAGLIFGSDGRLYVCSAQGNNILRYDGTTGAFVDAFVPAGSGGLQNPHSLAFGPDGNLYVSSSATNSILRFNGQTGAFIDAFVPTGSGGLSDPLGLTFGVNGDLYVSSSATNSILRFNGQTGAFMGAFVPSGSGGLSQPDGLTYAPDGNLLVASPGSHAILRYDRETGAFLGTFVPADAGPSTPGALLFTLEAPSGLTVTSDPPLRIDVSWTDNSDDATAFAIWRKSDNADWTRIGLVPPWVTTYADTTVSPSSHYTYRVRAISGDVASAWTNEATFTLPSAPPAPTDLIGSAVAPTQIGLSWKGSSDNVVAFAIWRKSAAGEWQRAGIVPPSTTSFTDSNLTPGLTYLYMVRAINLTGASDWSNKVSLATGTLPPAPTNLTASVLSGTQIQLAWQGSSDNKVAYFAIWRKTDGGEWQRVGVVAPGTTGFTDSDLTPGLTYRYLVRAFNTTGVSDWTNEVGATTAQ